MENSEDNLTSGRVTRSRVRHLSVDSESTSRPNTPVFVGSKLSTINEPEVASSSRRTGRRSSTSGIAPKTPAKTPIKNKLGALDGSSENVETPKIKRGRRSRAATPEVSVTPKRSSRARSLSLDEVDVGTKLTLNDPIFDVVPEEDVTEYGSPIKQIGSKRVTRSQSKSPLEIVSLETPMMRKSKKNMEEVKKDEFLEESKIINLLDETEKVEQGASDAHLLETEIADPFNITKETDLVEKIEKTDQFEKKEDSVSVQQILKKATLEEIKSVEYIGDLKKADKIVEARAGSLKEDGVESFGAVRGTGIEITMETNEELNKSGPIAFNSKTLEQMDSKCVISICDSDEEIIEIEEDTVEKATQLSEVSAKQSGANSLEDNDCNMQTLLQANLKDGELSQSTNEDIKNHTTPNEKELIDSSGSILEEENIPISLETATNEHDEYDLKTDLQISQKETVTNALEISMEESKVNESETKSSSDLNSDGPVISEIIELKSLSPETLIKVGASPDHSSVIDPKKENSQENIGKTIKPMPAVVHEKREPFDCETPNKQVKLDFSSNSKSVYFDKSLKEDTPKNTYPKTPFSLTKSRSYIDVESSNDNVDTSLKPTDKDIIEDKYEIDKKKFILENKTPSKSYSSVENLQSSTPFTCEKYEVYYEKNDVDDNEDDEIKNPDIQSSPASPDPIDQVASHYNKDTWSLGVSGQVNIDTKLDSLAEGSFIKSTVVDIAEDQKHININKASKFTGLHGIEYDPVTSEEEELDENEKPYQKHDYVEYEAMEVDNYHSGDSMNSEEREEIEQNEIPVEGESIGSEDTDEEELCDEDDEDKDSFIVSDDANEEQMAEFSDDEFAESDYLEKSKSKRKYKRIINHDFSESDEANDSNTDDANEVLLDEESTRENEVNNSVLTEEKGLVDSTEPIDKSPGIKVTPGKEQSSVNCNATKLNESAINLCYIANDTDDSSNDFIEDSALGASREEISKQLKASNKSKDKLSPKVESRNVKLGIVESEKDINVRSSILNLPNKNEKTDVSNIESSANNEVQKTPLLKSVEKANKCFKEGNIDESLYDDGQGAKLLLSPEKRKSTLTRQFDDNISNSSVETVILERHTGNEIFNAAGARYIGQSDDERAKNEIIDSDEIRNNDIKDQDDSVDDEEEKQLTPSSTTWHNQDSEKNLSYSFNLKVTEETQNNLKVKDTEDSTSDNDIDDMTVKMIETNESGVEIKKLDHLRKMFNPLSKTHRQSLNITSTGSNEDMAINKQIKRLKRQSFGVLSAQDFNPSQSLIDTIEAYKKLASPQFQTNKRKRLSKSFNDVGSLDSSVEIDEATEHTNKKSKLTLNVSSSDDEEVSEALKEAKKKMLLSSTPHEEKDDPNNNTYEKIMKRCEEIIAINKKNANEILKQIKGRKASKRLNEKKVPKKKARDTRSDDVTNKIPLIPLKSSAKTMTVKKTLKTSPKILKKVSAEFRETSKKKEITKVTRVGTFLEEPITPKKERKLEPLEVLENATGTITVFPATPKKKIIRGFVEEPSTPKSFSMKRRVQQIINDGQDTPPDLQTKYKRKRRYEDMNETFEEDYSQRKRLNHGKFVEENLNRTVARRGGTEYLIAKCNSYDLADSGYKQKPRPDIIFNEKALKFKTRPTNNEKKHADEILIRKKKKYINQKF